MNHLHVKRKLREIAATHCDEGDGGDGCCGSSGGAGGGGSSSGGRAADPTLVQDFKRATVETLTDDLHQLALPSAGLDVDVDGTRDTMAWYGGGGGGAPGEFGALGVWSPVAGAGWGQGGSAASAAAAAANATAAATAGSREMLTHSKRKKPLNYSFDGGNAYGLGVDPRRPGGAAAVEEGGIGSSFAAAKRMRPLRDRSTGSRPRVSALALPEHVWFLLSLFLGSAGMLALRLVCRSTFAHATDDCNWETLYGLLHGSGQSLLQTVLAKPRIGLSSAFSSYSPRSVSVSASTSPAAAAASASLTSSLSSSSSSSSSASPAGTAVAAVAGTQSAAADRPASTEPLSSATSPAAAGRSPRRRSAPRRLLLELLRAPRAVADVRYCYKHRLIFHFHEACSGRRRGSGGGSAAAAAAVADGTTTSSSSSSSSSVLPPLDMLFPGGEVPSVMRTLLLSEQPGAEAETGAGVAVGGSDTDPLLRVPRSNRRDPQFNHLFGGGGGGGGAGGVVGGASSGGGGSAFGRW